MTRRDDGGDGGGGDARAPGASMSLLADLLAGRVLDPGYAEAAARRRSAGREPGRGPAGRGAALLVLVLTGMLVAVAGAEVRRGEPVAAERRAGLIEEIRHRTDRTDALARQAEGVRDDIRRRRAAALARSETGRRVRAELARAGRAAAATEASGPGLVVTLDDAPADPAAGDARERSRDGRVYDQDLQVVVNGLWAAGATAIAVNGQRLGPTTAIRSAGQAILVDYRPLSGPYEVTAVAGSGGADALGAAFEGSYAERRTALLAERYGIRFDTREDGGVRVPAAGAPRLRYARAPGEEEEP